MLFFTLLFHPGLVPRPYILAILHLLAGRDVAQNRASECTCTESFIFAKESTHLPTRNLNPNIALQWKLKSNSLPYKTNGVGGSKVGKWSQLSSCNEKCWIQCSPGDRRIVKKRSKWYFAHEICAILKRSRTTPNTRTPEDLLTKFWPQLFCRAGGTWCLEVMKEKERNHWIGRDDGHSRFTSHLSTVDEH